MKKLLLFALLILVFNTTFAQIPIAEIQANQSSYLGQYVWIEGVITIGAGRLYSISGTPYLKAYIMDESGMGLQLYDPVLSIDYLTDIVRGNKILMYGEILEFQGNLEMIPDNYSVSGSGFNIDDYTIPMSIVQALNWQENEGTFVETTGIVLSIEVPNESGYTVILEDEVTGLDINVFNYFTNDILSEWWEIGSHVKVLCGIAVYNNQTSLYPGYQEDVSIITGTCNPVIPEAGITISPNPVSDMALIKFPDDSEKYLQGITLYNTSGQITPVHFEVRNKEIILYRSGIKSGVYLLECKGLKPYYSKLIFN